MQPEKRTLLLPCLILFFSAQVLPQCYHPNGALVNSTLYVPCNAQVGVASMCCATNKTSNADDCLPNGLCRSYMENSEGNGITTVLWRESCTDPTWKSPFCLNLCTTGAGQVFDEFRNYSQDDVVVLQCPDGSYCCGDKNTTCCNLGQGTAIANIIGAAPSSSSTTSSTSSTSTSSSASVSTTGPRTSASPTPKPSPSPSTGAKIGIGVGVGVGAALAILTAGAWIRARKKARTRRTETTNDYVPVNTQASPKPNEMPSGTDGSRFAHEIGDSHFAYEMEDSRAGKGVNELEGSRT